MLLRKEKVNLHLSIASFLDSTWLTVPYAFFLIDLIPQLSNLLSALFTSHDSLVLHSTSSTSLPSGSATDDSPIFNTSTSALSNSFLRQFVTLLADIRRNRKSDKAWEEFESFDDDGDEEGGDKLNNATAKTETVKRVLGILRASWEGADGWRWTGLDGKGKGKEKEKVGVKGKGKGKAKARPKGKGKSKRKKAAGDVDEESDEENEEDDFELRGRSEGTGGTTGPRRSSSRISGASSSSRSRSRSPVAARDEEADDDVDEDLEGELDNDDSVQLLGDALLAIRISLLVLLLPSSSNNNDSTSTLPKSLLSADFILSIISTLTIGTEKFLFPLHQHGSQFDSPEGIGGGAKLVESFEVTTRLLLDLVEREQVGEDVGIKLATFSLGPFFIPSLTNSSTAEKKTKSTTAIVEQGFKNFRVACMDLMGVIYERQGKEGSGEIRSWILEELLGNIRSADWKARRRSDKGGFRCVCFLFFLPSPTLLFYSRYIRMGLN